MKAKTVQIFASGTHHHLEIHAKYLRGKVMKGERMPLFFYLILFYYFLWSTLLRFN